MAKRYGTFEYGTVYIYDQTQPRDRGAVDGRLVVDQDNQVFYIKSPGKPSRRIPHDRVNWLLAHKMIDFDHEDSETYLIDYMMRLEEHREMVREQRLAQYSAGKEKKAIDESRKLVKKTKRNALLAKTIWFLGCAAIVGLGIFVARPVEAPAPAEMSIAGVGSVYNIDSSLLTNATYMTAIGNGSSLYGLIFDDSIIESGQLNSNESTIKENVMVNAGVSSIYPVHLRPLYYERSTFYQSQLVLDDTNQGSSAIFLQNPNGYSLTVPANELVLIGGQGMSSVVISSPDKFEAVSASEAAREIERAQEEASHENGSSVVDYKENVSAKMPENWNGYDYADIDADRIAASYWYTTDGTKNTEDLHRRVVIWDISPVINQGEKGVASLEPIQINYQDRDSNFYNPIISRSPSSNGARFWVGYTKQAPNGSVGFYIRLYENADDILVESYDNTLSTFDLTGTDYPITNYTLNGDRLFFEQQGYIWVMDLSKIQISVDVANNQRNIKKENPVRICRSSDIRPSITRDEAYIANVMHATTVPVAHYQVVRATTDKGIQYGIAFIESESGSIVFQPCTGATAAAAEEVEGENGNSGSTTGVSSGNQTALDKAREENARRNGQYTGSNESGSDQEAGGEGETANPDSTTEAGNAATPDTVSPAQESSGNGATTGGAGEPVVHQSAYPVTGTSSKATARQMANEVLEVDANDRILIRPGSAGDYQIICFCVRGEQFYWIEQSEADGTRQIMMSPIYYKNDAMQAIKQKDAEAQKDVDPGLQGSEGQNAQVAGKDTEVGSPDTVPDASDPTKRAEAARRAQEQQALLAQNNGNNNANSNNANTGGNANNTGTGDNATSANATQQGNQTTPSPEQQPPPVGQDQITPTPGQVQQQQQVVPEVQPNAQ